MFCNPVPNVNPEHYKIVNGETISDAEFEMIGLYEDLVIAVKPVNYRCKVHSAKANHR